MVHVLSGRTLLHPTDPERSRVFYGEQLGLGVYREFGTGPERGTVYFLGGGFLELSGRSETPPSAAVQLWMQVADVTAAHEELVAKGVEIVRPPVKEPWGLIEMWITDPDGCRIVLVEVPQDHPIRFRPGI
ncbi:MULTISPECIES: VOC family protein [unclassified Streptomyces]|uniref:VOC family protein n=1 Tax=unclassified Streptomyces TaxID=2593676 RepID=UPI002254D061|nr:MULTISPECIES: VOC family protein [unclassified Streptomyces]MCX5337437.1 VOC family protein [Streptomyces sp. NBC_00140]MCX5365612.1 VOC family protein [Streptomyces sp. NBC_00124]